MLKRTVLPAVLIILLGITLWAFKQNKRNDDSKEQLLLTAIGTILEQKHYSPKAIDDNFSKQVFKKYIESLNPDKNIFLQSYTGHPLCIKHLFFQHLSYQQKDRYAFRCQTTL